MNVILCDLGGVLLHVNFNLAMERLSNESGLSKQELNARIFSSGIKEKHDLGLVSSLDFYKHIITREEISFSSFQSIWSEIFTENRELIHYLSFYTKSCRLYIASNTDPLHYAFFCRNYPWVSLFTGFGLSFRLKSTKPSSEFYCKLCREFGINYQNALFIDDLQDNVRAAQGLGIKSHLFTDVAGLKLFMENEIIEKKGEDFSEQVCY